MTPAGYTAQDMTVCPVGHYCPSGTRSSAHAIPCPKGTYRADTMGFDVVDCGLCPAGKYCPTTGVSAPQNCPAGKFCPEGSWEPQNCPLGTYLGTENAVDSSDCIACTANFYCPTLGQTQVDPAQTCAKGFMCYGGAYRPEPTDLTTGDICPKGFWCDTGAATECTAGNYGVFQGAYDIGVCAPCEKGYYCQGGADEPIICPAGYYCPEGS
jgi:hypothetical protein